MAKQEKSAAEIYREERKKRLAKAAKKNSKKSISSQSAKIAGRVVSIIIVLAIVVAVGAVVVRQTGLIERSKTAFTIDGEPISQAEYEYYYMSIFNTYYQYAQYGYISLDTSSAPSTQQYGGDLGEIENFPEDQTPTWADFFEYAARTRLEYVKAAVKNAKEAGIEVDEEITEAVEKEVDEFSESATSSENSHYSPSAYLKVNYGQGMNMKLYRHILEEQQIGSKFEEMKTNEFSDALTNKEINEEYKNNMTNYGKISLLSFNVPAESVETKAAETEETSEDAESEETTTSAPTEKTLAKAKSEAEAIANAGSEAEFRSLCLKISKEDKNAAESTVSEMLESSYSDISGTYSDESLLNWVSDTKTQAGETYVYDDGSTGSTVFYMVNPIHKAPDSVVYDSRHILIKFPEAEAEETADDAAEGDDKETADSEDVTTTEAAKEEVKAEALDLSAYTDLGFAVENTVKPEDAQNAEAYNKIQSILKEYLDGEHTEEAFAALAEKYTEDEGSASNGGLYEDTAVGSFVAPYEDFCLADGRKAGDVGIVEYVNEDNYSGYHLIYFVKTENTTWKDDVKSDLASEKYQEYANQIAADAAKVENVNEKVTAEVVAFLDKLLKRNSSNSSAS